MAKNRAQPKGAKAETPPTPQYYATASYKRWARAAYEAKGWSLAVLRAKILKIDASANATSGGLSQFFGTKQKPAGPSNTTLMPHLNELLGAAPPPVCDPSDRITQLRDRLAARWSSMTPKEQKQLIDLLELEHV